VVFLRQNSALLSRLDRRADLARIKLSGASRRHVALHPARPPIVGLVCPPPQLIESFIPNRSTIEQLGSSVFSSAD